MTTAMWSAGHIEIEVWAAHHPIAGHDDSAQQIGRYSGDTSNGSTLQIPTIQVPASHVELRVVSNVSWTSFYDVNILGTLRVGDTDLTHNLPAKNVTSSSGTSTAHFAFASSLSTSWEARTAGTRTSPAWLDNSLGRSAKIDEVLITTGMSPAGHVEIEIWGANQRQLSSHHPTRHILGGCIESLHITYPDVVDANTTCGNTSRVEC